MVRLNLEGLKKLSKKGKYVLLAGCLGASLLLSGCGPKEVSTNAEIAYDIIDAGNEQALEEGVVQEREVPGQDFKLVIRYKCELEEDEKWVVTSDKKLNIEICTDGLPEGYSVYIDNVHIDTTICSNYPTMDGITQDTMDDRIHNSLMLGFPIADDLYYSNINQIAGQNDTFISGTVMGINGYSSGSVSEKRFVESDYLTYAVYANKIASIIDLIVVKPDGQMECTSVDSSVQVSVWPYIHKVKSNGEDIYEYYYYNESTGKTAHEELDANEYYVRTEQHSKTKNK